jgi:cell division protein FtsB
MTQVNLLPSDVKDRQRTRRLTAGVIMAVAAVVALLAFVFVLQAARLSDATQKLETQQAKNADLSGKIAQLSEFADLKAQVSAAEARSATALDGEVLWSGVLRDVSMVIPDEVWLSGMVGTLTPSSASTVRTPAPATPSTGATPSAGSTPAPATRAPATAPGTTLIGTIQFQGSADDHPSVAQWLTRVEQVTGWANPWITNSTEIDQNGVTTIQWSGSIDLTVEASVQGGKR